MDADDMKRVLTISDDLPIATTRPVHSGKVRSVYFLDPETSRRLAVERSYDVAEDSSLALMVISDRLSAFDCLWHGEKLAGVPGKGAALNAIAAHWFKAFREEGTGPHHLLDMPHPLLWVVRQARPVRVEAIARRYLTGSLWRAYAAGARSVGGVALEDGMRQYGRLPELLFTPSTKGIVRDVPGVDPTDDAPVAPELLRRRPEAFGLRDGRDVARCEEALKRGFAVIEGALARQGKLLVDTKFEFGFAPAPGGGEELIYMDEVGTPDSSRIWLRSDWEEGHPRERSKEQFREALLGWVEDREILLNPARMAQRQALARSRAVPDAFFEALADTYRDEAQAVLGSAPEVPEDPRGSLLDVLADLRVLR